MNMNAFFVEIMFGIAIYLTILYIGQNIEVKHDRISSQLGVRKVLAMTYSGAPQKKLIFPIDELYFFGTLEEKLNQMEIGDRITIFETESGNSEVKVIETSNNGNKYSYSISPKQLGEFGEDWLIPEGGESYTIEITGIDELQYAALPEFQGF